MMKLLIVLSLMLFIPLSANAQIVGNGTDNVIIHDYPFDITILEGGSFTLYNYNGTGSISIVSPGWFEEHEALENNTVTVRLTDEMIAGTYAVNDVTDDTIVSTIEVVKPFVEEPEEFVHVDAVVEIPAGNPNPEPNPVQPIVQTEITTDKEVLDLRLRILQVIESIFNIVLG